MYASLLTHIRKYVPLDEAEEKLLVSLTEYREVSNKDFLLQAGQLCTSNYFVDSGCLRMYLNTDYGTEQIIQFGISNWWICDYTSFDNGRPSDYFIQAVEKSSVVVFEKKVQEELLKKIPQLERYFRIIFQRAYSAQLSRIHFILNFSGEKRYHHFVESVPGFAQRVPQFMLASYLGFTPEFLSKIRGKKN